MMHPMIYQNDVRISSQLTDSTVKLGIPEAFGLFQDSFTCCLGALGCDNTVCRAQHNAYWVITKVRARFFRRPDWDERVCLRCFPVDSVRVRTHLNCEVLDGQGAPLILARQELCALPFEGRRAVRLSELGYPTEGFPPAVYDEPFRSFEFPEKLRAAFVQPVYSQLIDMSNHVNNIMYIRMAMCLFPSQYLHTHEIEDVEVHYLSEAQEGQTLHVELFEADAWYVRIRMQERALCELRLAFRG